MVILSVVDQTANQYFLDRLQNGFRRLNRILCIRRLCGPNVRMTQLCLRILHPSNSEDPGTTCLPKILELNVIQSSFLAGSFEHILNLSFSESSLAL